MGEEKGGAQDGVCVLEWGGRRWRFWTGRPGKESLRFWQKERLLAETLSRESRSLGKLLEAG